MVSAGQFRAAAPGSVDQWTAGLALVADGAQLLAAYGTAFGLSAPYLVTPATALSVLASQAKGMVERNEFGVATLIRQNGSPWSLKSQDANGRMSWNPLTGDISRINKDGTSIYVSGPDMYGNVSIQTTDAQAYPNAQTYKFPATPDLTGNGPSLTPPVTANPDGTMTLQGLGVALTIDPRTGSATISVQDQAIAANDDASVSYVIGGIQIDLGAGKMVTVRHNGETETRNSDSTGTVSRGGQIIETVSYHSDNAVYTSADHLTARTLWSDGTQTVDFRGNEAVGAYQATVVNGAELRSYGDGHMSFRRADGTETVVAFLDGDTVVLTDRVSGAVTTVAAAAFSWDRDVPGFAAAWAPVTRAAGDFAGGTLLAGGDRFDGGPVFSGDGPSLDYQGPQIPDAAAKPEIPQEPGGDWAVNPVVAPETQPIGICSFDDLLNSIQQSFYAPTQQPRCFAGTTPVLMADGSEKPIAVIVPGDRVLAFDERGDGLGGLVPATVTHVHDHGEAEVVRLEAGGLAALEVTPLHRFLTADGGFRPLAALRPGEALVGADGRRVEAIRVAAAAAAVRVYNLTVDGLHTYIAGGLRVHNSKPVVLDLDGNNRVELIGFDESGVLFDMDGDGYAENTAWVGPGDGMLAWDREGDGRITNAAEFVFSRYGGPAATDLDGLRAAFDTNHDSVLDARDQAFDRFGVWCDANQNGRCEAGEFVGLAALGIAAITLTAAGPAVSDNGNTLLGMGSFRRTDGTAGLLADTDLATDGNGFAEVAMSATTSRLVDETGAEAGAVASSSRVRMLNATTTGGRAFGSEGADLLFTTGTSAATLIGGAGDDVLRGAGGGDVLKGGLGADRLLGGGGNDILYIDAADTAAGTVDGGTGIDTVRVATTENIGLDLGAASIEIAFGNDGADTFFTTGNGAFLAHGGAGDDLLLGGAGNDVLYGDTGADVLDGGAGDDELHIDAADRQAGIDGGAGNDVVVIEGTAGVTFDLGTARVEYAIGGAGADAFTTSGTDGITIDGGAGDDQLSGGEASDNLQGGAGTDVVRGLGGDDGLRGGTGTDLLDGGTGNDQLDGGEDDDTLQGGAGNDVLKGGAGADVLKGGDGDDTLVIDAADRQADINGGAGNDTLYVEGALGTSFTLAVASVEVAYGGDGADRLSAGDGGSVQINGCGGDDILTGGAGDDVLAGGAGADILQGGTGNDTLVIDGFDRQADIDGGAGEDTVVIDDPYGVRFDLGAAHVEKAAGGIGGDRLTTSTSQGIEVDGGAGNDVLIGGAGNDTLRGGVGADVLKGGDGNDILIIDISDRAADIDGGAGRDTVRVEGSVGVTFDLSLAHVEIAEGGNGADRLTTSGAEAVELNGGAGDDILIGGAGNDTLIGGAGRDTLRGGGGDDTLVIDTEDLPADIDGGAGYDRLVVSGTTGVRFDLGAANIELGTGGAGADVLFTSATAATTINGGDSNDTLTGNSGADRLAGGCGDDVLIGGAGDDILRGDAGSDVLRGGEGDDTLIVDADDLPVNIDGGVGVDTLVAEGARGVVIDLGQTSIEKAAGTDAVDRLWSSGTATVLIDGKGGDDILTGGVGNDTLIGGAGHDLLVGGAGDDTLHVDADDDLTGLRGGTGRDTVIVDGSRGMILNLGLTETEVAIGGDQADTFMTSGVAAVSLFGGAGNDIMTGGAGSDSLDGGSGDDLLKGGRGNDLLAGGAGNDAALFDGRVEDYRIEVSHLDLNGSGQLTLSASVTDLKTGDVDVTTDIERLVFADRVIDLVQGNNAPVAVDDRLRAYRDTPITVSGAILRANDWDVENDIFWVGSVGNAKGGTVALDYYNQKVTFTPTVGFSGLASFDCSAYDPVTRQTSVATVSVEVDPWTPTNLPSDPLFPSQFHLFNTGQTGARPGFDINVTPVWQDYAGRGVVIANIEGQMEYTNPELIANYDTSRDWDYWEGDADPLVHLPTTDGHSTTTSGFLVAALTIHQFPRKTVDSRNPHVIPRVRPEFGGSVPWMVSRP